MTDRIREFLRTRREDGPCVVIDLDVVQDNYRAFSRALPDTRVFYAVKANPAPEVLALLARTQVEQTQEVGRLSERVATLDGIERDLVIVGKRIA